MAKPITPLPEFTPPDWKGEVGPHLEALRKYAEATIASELGWYFTRKGGRAKASRVLRVTAVVLSILGGLVPGRPGGIDVEVSEGTVADTPVEIR